jgi:hypothetical protein
MEEEEEVDHGMVHQELEAWVEAVKEEVIIILELYKILLPEQQIQVVVAVETDLHLMEYLQVVEVVSSSSLIKILT